LLSISSEFVVYEQFSGSKSEFDILQYCLSPTPQPVEVMSESSQIKISYISVGWSASDQSITKVTLSPKLVGLASVLPVRKRTY